MIRKATQDDIDVILKLTNACAEFMISKSIFQWNEAYPSKVAFEKDINREELYVLDNNNTIIGCVVISTLIDEEYKLVNWLTPNRNNIYIHRLAVHPIFQKQGFAQQLMTFAEEFSKNRKYDSIRLDTFSKNKGNQQFYEQRGYQRLETIHYPLQSEDGFYCYELVL